MDSRVGHAVLISSGVLVAGVVASINPAIWGVASWARGDGFWIGVVGGYVFEGLFAVIAVTGIPFFARDA